MSEFATPMMQQYLKIKKEHEDCLLLFRLGDFYEMFLDDAKVGAKVMDITLTSRDRGKDGRIPMAGVPYHALDSYLSKLVKEGHKVAICEQVSEPSAGAIVEREVVRIVTPGTVLDDKSLDSKENNYLVSVSLEGNKIGFAFADISTGEFLAAEHKGDNLEQMVNQELSRFNPTECVLSNELYNDPVFLRYLTNQKGLNIYPFHNWPLFAFDEKTAKQVLKDHFEVSSLHAYSLEDKSEAIKAAAALLGYLKHTQKGNIKHLTKITKYTAGDQVDLDRATIVNLELFSTIRERNKVGSLLNTLDKTTTAMGGRLLKKWLTHPLRKKKDIEDRHEVVELYKTDRFLRKDTVKILGNMSDMERLLSRVSVGVGNARDLINLKHSLKHVLSVKKLMDSQKVSLLKELQRQIPDELNNTIKVIERFIVEEPPVEVKEGNLIKSGVNNTLDDLREGALKSKSWISRLEKTERQRTGIGNLKVSFNKVFGYYIEISKSHVKSAPSDYLRKQTLVNAERFITPELKEKEEQILKADEEIKELEYEIYLEVVNEVLKFIEDIQAASQAVATLDCLLSFAEIAEKHNYCRPKINRTGIINIKEGRHPVVERLIEDYQFVPNDVYLDTKDNQLLIITGPNMAGKSVFIRQIALIVLLAHVGAFVPASEAEISLVDRIFVRSGASDIISEGLSTFMVEMIEAAHILSHASKKSLIVMDEIGRGTSTYDGISIASATAEYLVTHFKEGGPKTLFATHYHELQELEDRFLGIKNYQVIVKHDGDSPVFLHKVVPGGASHSFGVAVAKLAGVPDSVVERANEILERLENGKIGKIDKMEKTKKKIAEEPVSQEKPDSELVKKIKKIDVEKITPLEAIKLLDEIIHSLLQPL